MKGLRSGLRKSFFGLEVGSGIPPPSFGIVLFPNGPLADSHLHTFKTAMLFEHFLELQTLGAAAGGQTNSRDVPSKRKGQGQKIDAKYSISSTVQIMHASSEIESCIIIIIIIIIIIVIIDIIILVIIEKRARFGAPFFSSSSTTTTTSSSTSSLSSSLSSSSSSS